jgi:hypothetical protein
MKKITAWFFAIAMIMSAAFAGELTSGGANPFAAKAQVTVSKKRRPGVIRSTYRGGKYVVRRTWDGTKWVSRKVWVGTKYTGRKTYQGTKWVGKKSYKTGRKVVSRTKKIVY